MFYGKRYVYRNAAYKLTSQKEIVVSDQQEEEAEEMVSVPYDALYQVLFALNGPPYLISEL